MAIRVADGGASVSTGTYSGEGTATVTWVTTGVAAGTYYYQCTNHAGMVGQIVVESTENRQGSAGANGTMEVCRGKTYTITLVGLTNGLTYNLFSAAAPQAGTTNAITSAEGNSAPSGTAYSGSAVTFTFTPNETTPDTVYLSSASNTSDQVAITVNDLAYVPGWATPAPSNQLVLDDSDGTHTFTINSNNQSQNLQWTLPAIPPATNDKIMQVSTAGNITYIDKPQGFYEGGALLTDTLLHATTQHPLGTSANTWAFNTNLNRIAYDPENIIVSLSSGVFTLAAGTYDIFWTQSSTFCNGMISGLFDSSGGLIITGSRGFTSTSYDYYAHIHGWHRLVVSSQQGYKMGLKTQTGGSYYFGAYYSPGVSQSDVYDNSVQIYKLAT